LRQLDQAKVVSVLNRLLEAELAGVVRYTHYSFLVFGFGRIPIVSWLREQASESLLHAQQVGEWIITLGAYPSLAIGPLLDSHQHDIAAMLRESLDTEELRAADVNKMLRKPGDVAAFSSKPAP
jgi:bacterioferritin